MPMIRQHGHDVPHDDDPILYVKAGSISSLIKKSSPKPKIRIKIYHQRCKITLEKLHILSSNIRAVNVG
jgi:hypothetical protein